MRASLTLSLALIQCIIALCTHNQLSVPSASRLGLTNNSWKDISITAATKGSPSSPPPPEQPSRSEIWSSIALVTGTTVGAGILALPAITAASGFAPSTIALVGSWAFMASTGLLFAEIAANLVKQDPNNKGLGILAMSGKLLGQPGAIPSGILYAGIHYALLVAYIAGAGKILSSGILSLSSMSSIDLSTIPSGLGPLLFTAIVGGVLTFGSQKQIDAFNNAWVAAVGASFCALLSLVLPSVKVSNLADMDFSAVPKAIPIMLVALVYHNIVPAISSQLKYNKAAVTEAIVVGSALPLGMFLLWNGVILGVAGGKGGDPLAILQSGAGDARTGFLVNAFSEAAIITSFTGFVIGLLSFLQDLGLGKEKSREPGPEAARSIAAPDATKPSPLLYALVLIPPLIVAIISPDIFLPALDFAGSYGITLLFGGLPVLMAALLRRSVGDSYDAYLPGGSIALLMLMGVVVTVVGGKLVGAF